jgi:hypothetical protein
MQVTRRKTPSGTDFPPRRNGGQPGSGTDGMGVI